MSAKQKARLIVLPVLLTMLFVSLRYTLRPVDLYTLMPELEVDQIDVLIIRSGGGRRRTGALLSKRRTRNFRGCSPGWRSCVLSAQPWGR